jgi:hypothetical protein
MLGTLQGVLAHGAETVRAEVAAQGHTLTAADLAAAEAAVADAASGTALMLGKALEMSAASKAVQLANLPAADRAKQVRDHLESLTGANADYELRGLVTKAQNTGRFAQLAETPDGTRYYASELLDANVCENCAEEDGVEFDNLEEAQGDYPCGYALCLGGDRCRGTVVAVLPEAAPSA